MKRFLNHTQRRITVGRAPPDEWSARRRDLYLSTYNTHKRQTSLPLAGIEPLISTGKWPQTHGLRPRGHWDRLLELITNCKPRIAVDYFNVNSNFLVITPQLSYFLCHKLYYVQVEHINVRHSVVFDIWYGKRRAVKHNCLLITQSAFLYTCSRNM